MPGWRCCEPCRPTSGSSAVASRAASTAYGFRTALVLAPVTAASVRGVQLAFSAAVTAAASLAREQMRPQVTEQLDPLAGQLSAYLLEGEE